MDRNKILTRNCSTLHKLITKSMIFLTGTPYALKTALPTSDAHLSALFCKPKFKDAFFALLKGPPLAEHLFTVLK